MPRKLMWGVCQVLWNTSMFPCGDGWVVVGVDVEAECDDDLIVLLRNEVAPCREIIVRPHGAKALQLFQDFL